MLSPSTAEMNLLGLLSVPHFLLVPHFCVSRRAGELGLDESRGLSGRHR